MNDIVCPFCDEKDFDLVGLKAHLQRWCEAFDKTETIMQEHKRLKEESNKKPK